MAGNQMMKCEACGWRHWHTVPCERDDCPHDAAVYATIARALDNAVANGCAEELSKMSAEDIAYDLARLDSACERIDISILKAGVRAWLHPQPVTVPNLVIPRELLLSWSASLMRAMVGVHDDIAEPIRRQALQMKRVIELADQKATEEHRGTA